MIFFINILDSLHQVTIYENISDLTKRVEWQDVFEGSTIVLDHNGIIYKWDDSKKEELGTIYDYTMVATPETSILINKCMEVYKKDKDIIEFEFTND